MSSGKSLRRLALLCWAATLASPAWAHIGTASVFAQGKAGPYPVYVTVTPPAVIPGEATVSVLCDAPGVRSVVVQSNVLAGESSRNMPAGQQLEAGPAGSHEFHGTTWIMTQGSWQIRLGVYGDAGSGILAVPLPASPTRLMQMSRPFAMLLILLGALLLAGLASIAAAAVREAVVEPGVDVTPARSRMGRNAALVALAVSALLLFAGQRLWRQEIARYSTNIYHPLTMKTSVSGDGVLHLQLRPPSAVQEVFSSRRLDDLVLDHNHLMHLYLIRWPAMDVVFHLHPEQRSAGDFDLALPAVPAGTYRLFADIVHANGFPETATAEIKLDVPAGRPLAGDDARGDLPAFPGQSLQAPQFIVLPDGYRYRFAVGAPGQAGGQAALRANSSVVLGFTLLDPAGEEPRDMANYMGMQGHVAIVKPDGSVFAHIHPDGSASMAASMMANAAASNDRVSPGAMDTSMGAMDMSSMDMGAGAGPGKVSNIASFPFGFPTPGTYRVIVQMKHGSVVETGAADVLVN